MLEWLPLKTEDWAVLGTVAGAALAAWIASRKGVNARVREPEPLIAHVPDELLEAMRAANIRDAAMEARQLNIEEILRSTHGRVTEIHRQTSILIDRGDARKSS